MSNEAAVCSLCGEPMPTGEEMFNYHGYSGPCPKPPLPKTTTTTAQADPDSAEWWRQIAQNLGAELHQKSAELTRLTALLEDRQGLLVQIIHWANEYPAIAMNIRMKDLYPLADRLIAYLKGQG